MRLSKKSNPPVIFYSLDELIDSLSQFGCPELKQRKKLFSDDLVWVCRCELHTGVKGTNLQTKSEIDCSSAREAAAQCLERVVGSLGKSHEPSS